MESQWTHKGQGYRFVKTSGGYDVFRVGTGWIGWSAGSMKDARDMVKSMVKSDAEHKEENRA